MRPVGKFDALYWELINVSKNKENVFDLLRDRCNVASEEKASCPRRHGIPMQRLMGTAAMLIDWFRFCIRQGYLPSHLAKPGELEQRDKYAERALDNQMRLRRAEASTSPTVPPPSA